MGSKIIKAHIRTNPPDVQSLESHLLGTAAIAGKNAGKIHNTRKKPRGKAPLSRATALGCNLRTK